MKINSNWILPLEKKDEEEDDEGDDDEPERSPSPEADPSKSKGSYKYEETLDVISAVSEEIKYFYSKSRCE